MRVPLRWLADHLDGDLPDTHELAERLSIAGVKVERIHRLGPPPGDGNLERFVAGLVVEAGKHPNADRLQLCRVDTGEAEPRQIVCGAWNFGAGDTVAVAVPGAILADGRTLERARLRGEVSNGMILSERELDLSPEHGGILVLDGGLEPGVPLTAALPLTDDVLELEISSNRPDLLSVRGVARDVAAVFGLRLHELDEHEPQAAGERPTADWVHVATEEPELCPRFTARVFDGVRIGPSPLGLRARLHAVGIRPISNAVDVTNYVMHDLGNPLHAYDHRRIAGAVLVARRARPGERLTTLDGKERELDPSILVIADAEGPNGIAGIMGGAHSEISDDTTTVVLEAANFERTQVMRASQRLGLRTDGSNRWEKGVDPHLAPHASRAAARLMLELTGARMMPEPLDVHAALPARARIHLRGGRVEAVTGMTVPRERQTTILARLGFDPVVAGDGTDVLVPTPRWLDVTREIDVVEEVARIHGLDNVPSGPPMASTSGGLSPFQRVRRAIGDACVGAGLDEVQTMSLQGPAMAERLMLGRDDPRRAAVRLRNPLSSEHSQLRTLLLGSLLEAVAHNVAVGREDVAVWELAHVYRPRPGERLPDEPWTLGAVLHGRLGGARWNGAGPAASFFVAKGVLEAVLGSLGVPFEVEPGGGRDPFLHPGRAARVRVDGRDIGFLGELHPMVAERFDLPLTAAGFELEADALAPAALALRTARELPDTPPLRQDIAVVVGDGHAAAEVLAVVRETGGDLLVDASVFDVYTSAEQLGPGRRSLGIRLTFQAPDRTLSDDEVRPLREAIVAALERRVGAVLR